MIRPIIVKTLYKDPVTIHIQRYVALDYVNKSFLDKWTNEGAQRLIIPQHLNSNNGPMDQ